MFEAITKVPLRFLPVAILAAAVACRNDPTAPRLNGPSRSVLNGSYTCVGFKAFYQGPDGLGYYRGSCLNYLMISNPTRADSTETFPFTINPNNDVSRVGFPGGVGMLQYDDAAARATIVYQGRSNDDFDVTVDAGAILFEQTLVFDFSGDRRADSLFLTFMSPGP